MKGAIIDKFGSFTVCQNHNARDRALGCDSKEIHLAPLGDASPPLTRMGHLSAKHLAPTAIECAILMPALNDDGAVEEKTINNEILPLTGGRIAPDNGPTESMRAHGYRGRRGQLAAGGGLRMKTNLMASASTAPLLLLDSVFSHPVPKRAGRHVESGGGAVTAFDHPLALL